MTEKRVAIIGAGAAGLITAKTLLDEGCKVTVFEQAAQAGGTWVYQPEPESDGLGGNERKHGSLYASLTTNLPRDLMAFRCFTFDSAGGGEDSWPRYPHHTQVLEYLNRFANHFDLGRCIQFQTPVSRVTRESAGGWSVVTGGANGSEASFDAVVVCNGHYSEPRIPSLSGVEHFNGERLHSHNYRTPDRFAGKRVALWGAAASGVDISREISSVAAMTLWCGDRLAPGSQHTTSTPSLATSPSPLGFSNEGQLILPSGDAGNKIDIDVLIYCTGYHYHFNFLDESIVHVNDNQVSPLYLDLIPPRWPTLAFVGIPYLVIPFPLFEVQAQWLAAALSGRMQLPSTTVMQAWVSDRNARLNKLGVLPRHTHRMAQAQFEYMDTLCSMSGAPGVPDWMPGLATLAQQTRAANPDSFRAAGLPSPGPTVVTALS